VTAEAATHAEAKPEGSKDTRALEQSYLARGQALRVVDQRRAVADVLAMSVRDFGPDDVIAVGALVTVDEDGQEQTLFVAPHGGGTELAGKTVRVVTPGSPIGRALLGRRAGDEVEREVGGKARSLEIVAVR
jgi:transcription elongation GreA/GreB family factor